MRLIALAAAVALAAGCVSNAPVESADAAPPPAASATVRDYETPYDADLRIAGTACEIAGGVSQNPSFLEGVVPEPWEAADTTEYLALPVRESGTVFGNAHLALVCESMTVNGATSASNTMGFVGLVVEPPGFEGVEPTPRNFLMSTVATNDPAIAAVLEAEGFHGFYPGTGTLDVGAPSPEAPAWPVSAVVETDGDGTYVSDLALKAEGDSWGLLRMWLIVSGADGRLHVAALDFAMSGGTTYLGDGYFSHSGTDDHPPVGRADAPMGGLGFRTFDLEMTLRVLPTTVGEMWAH